MAWEYGPMAFGASSVAIACRTAGRSSGGLGDLARPEAARADADPAHAAVDQRSHRLQVRLEPAGAHVVGVAHRPADDRPLVTNFAALGHCNISTCPARVPVAWTNTEV